MVRLYGLLGILVFFFWIYCVFDVIAADEALVRNLPKTVWLIVVLIFSAVGSVAWLALGRPENLSFRPGSTDYRTPRPPIGPEDRPDFGSRMDERARDLHRWEEDLRRREDDLRRREDGG